MDNTAQATFGCHSADVNNVLNDQDIKCRCTLFGQMFSTVLCVLHTLEDKDDSNGSPDLFMVIFDKTYHYSSRWTRFWISIARKDSWT